MTHYATPIAAPLQSWVSTPSETPGDFLAPDASEIADLTIGLGDLVRLPTRTPHIHFYGTVRLIIGAVVVLEDRRVGMRLKARLDEVQLVVTAAALESARAKQLVGAAASQPDAQSSAH